MKRQSPSTQFLGRGLFSPNEEKRIDEAAPQIKGVSAALEAGEKLGKYKNILPLLELLDENNVSETEALIAMWNVSNRFNTWVAEHYRTSPKGRNFFFAFKAGYIHK